MPLLLEDEVAADVFQDVRKKHAQVEEISKFILIFYVKYWFQTPLPTAAARNDLNFIANMLRYRLVAGFKNSWKEGMARKLHSLKRKKIEGGKPKSPLIDLS